MKEKHLDCKGKEIQIGDIVLIHDWNMCDIVKCPTCTKIGEKYVGTLGIVVDFGCIQVTTYDKIPHIIWREDTVEVVGNVR